jgi:hypothetical protein
MQYAIARKISANAVAKWQCDGAGGFLGTIRDRITRPSSLPALARSQNALR